MKKNLGYLLIVLSSFSLAACEYLNLVSNRVYISEFPEERTAAVSFTFDDNYPSSLSYIAPMFEKYEFKATFFVIPNQVNDTQWPEWKKLSEKGFEIGNHSLNHLTLTQIKDTTQLHEEINHAYQIIEDKIGAAPFSFAHPGHATNEAVDKVVFQKHYATRVSPLGFCEWWGVVSSSDVTMLEKNLRDAIKKNTWLVVAAHGVEDGWQPIKIQFLEQCLSLVKAQESQIWVDHFGNLAKYKIEKQKTSLSIKELEGRLNITLESSLDTAIFNYPLTVVLDDPKYKRAKVNPMEGTSIVNLTYHKDKIILKLLPKSKVQIQKL